MDSTTERKPIESRSFLDFKRSGIGAAIGFPLLTMFLSIYVIYGDINIIIEDPFLSDRYALFFSILLIGSIASYIFLKYKHTKTAKTLIKYIDFFWYSTAIVTVLMISVSFSKELTQKQNTQTQQERLNCQLSLTELIQKKSNILNNYQESTIKLGIAETQLKIQKANQEIASQIPKLLSKNLNTLTQEINKRMKTLYESGITGLVVKSQWDTGQATSIGDRKYTYSTFNATFKNIENLQPAERIKVSNPIKTTKESINNLRAALDSLQSEITTATKEIEKQEEKCLQKKLVNNKVPENSHKSFIDKWSLLLVLLAALKIMCFYWKEWLIKDIDDFKSTKKA